MASDSAGPRPGSRRHLLALAMFAVVAAALGGWSLFWQAAARQTDAVLTSWIQQEAELGRQWSCPERHVRGYPLDIEVSCADVTFQGDIFERRFAGSLRGFRASSSVVRPDHVSAQIDPPFAGKTPDGEINFTLNWAKLDLTLDGGPEALTRLALEGEQLSLKGSIAGLWALDSQARAAQASVTPAQRGGESACDFAIAISGAEAPALSGRLGLSAPLDAAVSGTITKLDAFDARTFVERAERWRAAGGRLDLKFVRLTSGEAKVDAHGGFDLDAAHRPRGRLDAAFEGLDPILRRLGVDPRLLAAGSLLTSFLGNGPAKEKEEGSENATRLPLRVADGWLSIGPIRTPVRLPPLY